MTFTIQLRACLLIKSSISSIPKIIELPSAVPAIFCSYTGMYLTGTNVFSNTTAQEKQAGEKEKVKGT